MNILTILKEARASLVSPTWSAVILGSFVLLSGCGGNDVDTGSSFSSNSMLYEQADGINGGRLYSKFWAAETGFSLSNSELDNQSQLDNISDHSDFFRCKQCHGWDRLGREGGYSNRAPSTSRPNVSPVNLAWASDVYSTQELFDKIKSGPARRSVDANLDNYDPNGNNSVGDQMPDYSQILTDEQIWDLVKYLKEESIDTTELYTINLGGGVYPNRSRTFTDIGGSGSAFNGDTIFVNNCAACHGADGTKILVDGGEYTVGAHMRSKPYEDQHKVKFGHLGSIMGPVLAQSDISDIRDLFKALNDATKYPDSAPVLGLDGEALFEQYCGDCHRGNGMGSGFVHDVTNHPASEIKQYIQFEPDMQFLSFLTDEEIDAIAEALKP